MKLIRRVTWMHLSQQAQVVAVDEKTLTLGFRTQGARDNFAAGGHEEILRQAAIDAIGQDWRIETIVDPSAQPGAAPYSGGPAVSTSSPTQPEDRAAEPAPDVPDEPRAAAAPQAPAAPTRQPPDPAALASARDAIQETRAQGEARRRQEHQVSDSDASPDDPDADDDLAGPELLQRELGAHIIEEIKHE